MDDLKTEHYKALREEYRQYLYQVQQHWNFKLSAIGLIILTCVFNDKIQEKTGINADTIIAIGFCVLPVLAFLIDLKTLEVGLHVKLISDHLKKHFSELPAMAEWEDNLWSKNKKAEWRTRLTVLSAVGTSSVILLASMLVVWHLKNDWLIWLVLAAVGLLILLFIMLRRVSRMLFIDEPPLPQAPSADAEPPVHPGN